MRSRLEILACALTGESILVPETDAQEVPALDVLPLPRFVRIADSLAENHSIYMLRVLQFALARKKNWTVPLSIQFLYFEAVAHSFKTVPALRTELSSEFPGLAWLKEPYPDSWLGPFPAPVRRASHLQGKSGLEKNEDSSAAEASIQTDIQIRSVVLPEVRELKKEDENPVVHVFEKVLTAEEYQGGNKSTDTEDETLAHEEALRELVFKNVIRTSEQTRGFLKSNAIIDGPDTDVMGPLSAIFPTVVFPEWFQSEKRLKPEWCKVFESVQRVGEKNALQLSNMQMQAARGIERRLQNLFNQEVWKNRQSQGQDIDIDAVVRFCSDLSRGGTPDPRIFIDRQRLEKDLAICILVDASLSTDSWAQNRRILDNIKDTALILTRGLKDFESLFSVAAFHSHTRHHIDFIWLKRFEEPWGITSSRLAALQPKGHTRMGPAIRNATMHLMKLKARRRALFLVSDGRPSDLDRYEGRHGNADVKRAVFEAGVDQIFFKAFLTSEDGSAEVGKIFYPGQYVFTVDEKSLSDGITSALFELMK